MNMTMCIASATALALLHSLWEVALLALLAWLSLALLRRASAAARHAVGMAWLLAMAVAPVVTFAVCWRGPGLPGVGTQNAMPVHIGALGGEGPAGFLADAKGGWLLMCIAQLWLLGVVLMVVRQAGGWRAVRQIERRACQPLPAEWQQRVKALRVALGISREVVVRMAEHVVSPFTAHVLRPLIWLPASLLTQLPREQIEALLAHELAHIRRLDWCWNAVQCVIESVLFHHPGMWWLSRRIREEREHACDDLAVGVCGDAITLAEALAALQRQRRTPGLSTTWPAAAPALVLAAEGGPLMKRVSHLLSVAPARPGWRWPGVLLLLLCSSGLLAMQVVPPTSLLINLRFDASSQGELTPGNYRQYTASYLGDKQRSYRVSMDAAGHIDEVYAEDGQRRPLDANARRWLKSVELMNASTALPSLPSLAAPALPPPAPVVPPKPPAPSESAEFKRLMAGVEVDPRVIAVTGQPVTLDRTSFHGSVHLWGSRDFHLWGIDDPVGGKASFTAAFVGPKGRANVEWSGKTEAGVWKAASMQVSPQS